MYPILKKKPFIGPDSFKGFPKAGARKKQRNNKHKVSSCIPTDTPEKNRIENKTKEKLYGKRKLSLVRKELFNKKKKIINSEPLSSEDEDDYGPYLPCDSSDDETEWSPEIDPSGFEELDRKPECEFASVNATARDFKVNDVTDKRPPSGDNSYLWAGGVVAEGRGSRKPTDTYCVMLARLVVAKERQDSQCVEWQRADVDERCAHEGRDQAALEQVQRNLAPHLCHRLRCNRSGVTLLLVSLSQAALEQVQSNLAPRLCHRLRCNRSGATSFLYAPEIFWSSRTVERKWIRCVLVTALRSGPAQPYLSIVDLV
uniref:Uncharacterized protein n=1 Tax=Timema bartmani TaxID=61472 RepID=A0A7R9HYX3_9NEOP|nr:unnamed protein product [Timema bartmani]